MRKMLNTLYVTTPNSYLTKEGENIIIKIEGEEKFRIPAHNLENILCFGYSGASPALMAHCAAKGIGLAFFSPHGKFLARVNGPVSGNVLLRKEQYRQADDQKACTRLAKNFILGKVANSRTVLRRGMREYDKLSSQVDSSANYLRDRLSHVQAAGDLDTLRGIEGESARAYFDVFDELIRQQKDNFFFVGRTRRPPLDRMNSLLSFFYTMLHHDMQSALESVGLDPAVGFLHRDRPGRASLALDMMEELRPVLADRLALSLVNRKQIGANDFYQKENGAILLQPDTKKILLTAWQKKKQEEVMHPFLEEKIPIGLIPYTQALLMARTLRGDLDEYPPFFWR